MVLLAQFFVLSFRGDVIVKRDYLSGLGPETTETFFRKVKFWEEGDAPPVFQVEGTHYMHVKQGGVFLVATTQEPGASAAMVIELLNRIAKIVKDYCGELNEDILRTNFILVYELLDEIIDLGYPQNMSTEHLKRYVLNKPIRPPGRQMPKWEGLSFDGTRSGHVNKSVMDITRDSKGREEIFVDIIESISITFNSSGNISTSEINGTIQMRSFLRDNPDIRIALNDDLQIANRGAAYGSELGVVLDDCNFAEVVRLDSFDADKTITMTPPDGEFGVMNYRTTRDYVPPFRVTTALEEIAPSKVELLIKLKAEFPQKNVATGFVLTCPVPKSAIKVNFEMEKGAAHQRTDHSPAHHVVKWGFGKIKGGEEHTLAARISLDPKASVNLKRETGPVNLQFTIPSYNVSRLQVKYLQIMKEAKGYNPNRWVRYITKSESYVSRV